MDECLLSDVYELLGHFSLVLNVIYKAGLLEKLNKNPFGHAKVSYLEEEM